MPSFYVTEPRTAASQAATLKLHSLQRQQAQRQAAAARPADPYEWWLQLLAEEAELQQRESIMTVRNLRWSTVAWDDIHARAESLSKRMASCIELMKEVQ